MPFNDAHSRPSTAHEEFERDRQQAIDGDRLRRQLFWFVVLVWVIDILWRLSSVKFDWVAISRFQARNENQKYFVPGYLYALCQLEV